MKSKKKLKSGGKVKKKLALGSLIQDDDTIKPFKPNSEFSTLNEGREQFQDYSLSKPKPLAVSGKLNGQINTSTAKPSAGQGVQSVAKNIPLWGQVYGATSAISKGISGDQMSTTNNAVANVISPSTGVLSAFEDHDTKGALLSAVNPIYGGALAKTRAVHKRDAKRRELQSIQDANLLNNADQPTLMRKGGRLSKKLQVEGGGSLDQITPEAAKVNAPGGTDKLDTKNAKLDDKEIVDKQDRVFSDDRGYAKIAERLYKQKSKTPRFGQANERIEGKLDELFAHQEATNPENKGVSLEDGGMITTDGNSSSLGPGAFQSNYGKKVKGKLKAKHLRTPKKGFDDGGTVESTGASATKKIKNGLGAGGWADLATTVAPNIVNAYLQTKLKGPIAPQLVTHTKFERADPSAQLADLDRDSTAANELITRNTAQASSLTSAIGSQTAKKANAKNQIYGQTQFLNSRIQNNEAGLNFARKSQNADRTTGFLNEQVHFGNKKLQMTSENVANLSGKLQAMSSENKQRALDREKYKIMMEAYSDLPQAMKAKYKTFNDGNLFYSKGGRLVKALSKRNTKKG